MIKKFNIALWLISTSMCLILCQTELASGEEADHHARIKQICQDVTLEPQEKMKKIHSYVERLSFEEVLNVAKVIDDSYDNIWNANCVSEMAIVLSPYINIHKPNLPTFISEVANKERTPAWRWVWLGSGKAAVKGSTSLKQKEIDHYTSALSDIVNDKEDEAHVRIRALQQLRQQYLGPPQQNKKAKKRLAENLALLKEPKQSEGFLLKLIEDTAQYIRLNIGEREKTETALKKIFSDRKLYSIRFQIRLARVLFQQLEDHSVSFLAELQQISKEASSKIDKALVRNLIKKVKLKRYKQGLEPIE